MKSQRQLANFGLIAFLLWGTSALAAGEPAAPESQDGPERREIDLKHIWTGERLTIVYKTGVEYDPDAMAKLSWFLRDWRCRKSAPVDPALIDLLYGLYRDLGAKGPIRVLSGYRSEGLNASMLRSGRVVDPNSQHMAGKAVDVVFSGVPSAALRNMALARHAGGVGYYPTSRPAFVHVDTGRARDWEEAPGGRSHRRLRLDCNLTMADALKEVDIERALKALPLGAASQEAEGSAKPGAERSAEAAAPSSSPAPSPSVELVAGEASPMLVATAREGLKRSANAKSAHDGGHRHRRLEGRFGKAVAKHKSKIAISAKNAKCGKPKGHRAACAGAQKQKKKRRR